MCARARARARAGGRVCLPAGLPAGLRVCVLAVARKLGQERARARAIQSRGKKEPGTTKIWGEEGPGQYRTGARKSRDNEDLGRGRAGTI